jgi:AbrB family looped-hinge helix DNA binding protein
MKSTVSEKGQVTIPKGLRDRLGLSPGVVLEFAEERGKLVARKARSRDPVDAVYGVLKLGKGTDKLMTTLRGKPDAV